MLSARSSRCAQDRFVTQLKIAQRSIDIDLLLELFFLLRLKLWVLSLVPLVVCALGCQNREAFYVEFFRISPHFRPDHLIPLLFEPPRYLRFCTFILQCTNCL